MILVGLLQLLTGVMWGWWWWSCLSWWWLYEDLFSEMIRIGLLSCHKDPQYKIMNHIIKNNKWGWISHCLLTMGDPQSSLRTGTNFVLDKSNSWINFDEFNSKHNFSANSDGEMIKWEWSLSSILEIPSKLFSTLRLNSQNCAPLLSSATLKFVTRQTLLPLVYSSRKRF